MAFKWKALKRYIRLQHVLQFYMQTLPAGVDVDNMLEEWKQGFRAALDEVAPRVTKVQSHKGRHCPWMTKELLNRLFSHNVVTMETSATGWPPWLITYLDLKKSTCSDIVHGHDSFRFRAIKMNQGGHPIALVSMVTTLLGETRLSRT